jgi:hypothetical protein
MPPLPRLESNRARTEWVVALVVYSLVLTLLWVVRIY